MKRKVTSELFEKALHSPNPTPRSDVFALLKTEEGLFYLSTIILLFNFNYTVKKKNIPEVRETFQCVWL